MESTENNQNPISVPQHAMKWGLIIGVIGLILGVIIYIVDVSLWGEMKVGLIVMAITLGLVIYAGIQCRKDMGGFLEFKQGWLHGFIVFAIAGLISTLFQIVMFNVVDPGAVDTIVEKGMENTESMMENFGMPEDQMGEALEEAETSMIERFTPLGSLTGFLWGLIVYAILACITGAIAAKKNKDLEAF